MKYNLEWLTERYTKGDSLKYVFFWGHQPRKDGLVSDSCFSQWWQSAFIVEGITYLTAEHWMMAEKARLFNDTEVLEKILQARTPAEAKKLGREVKNFDPAEWDTHKYAFVRTGNLHKFAQHLALKEYLLKTGTKILVEASPMDRIWGIGMAKTHENIEKPTHWKGLNLLGFALMEVREELQEK